MLKKLLLALVVVALGLVAVISYYIWKGPDLSDYDHLIEPAISTRPPQTMIVVETVGDPNVMASRAYEQLYDLYYGLEGVDLWPLPTPRARWIASPDLPKEAWTGMYGLPVPDGVKDLPDHAPVDGMTVRLATWTYGEVVELLYIGSYDKETPSVQRMQRFVEERGYAFTGLHEEEYLKGPGMILTGNPDEYVTILRYEIGPSEDSGSEDTTAEPSEETAADSVEVPVVE